MRCLRISRIFEAYSLDLVDRQLSRHEGGQTTVTNLQSLPELEAAIERQLGMPRALVERAVAILERLTGKPFFGESGAATS